MDTFYDHLVTFAKTKGDEIFALAEATGSIEGWIRAEAALAVQRGLFGGIGESDRVFAESGRTDLAVYRAGKSTSVEFKVAFNNKNLIGGYNGTEGIAKDIKKLAHQSFDEKYVAVFLAFYSRHVYAEGLNKFYGQQAKGIHLQPKKEEDFGFFCSRLADQVVRMVASSPSQVHVVQSQTGRWLGFWCHQVT